MKRLFGFLVLSIIVLACSKENQTARLEVRLTDAPGDYQEVNIDIQGIEVNNDVTAEAGWKSLDVQSGVYNLLKLSNGLDTLLATAELPVGRISQIRLILGDHNSVKIGDQKIALFVPSGQQSGLKLNVQAELTAGINYQILLDFDAARSIVKNGNEAYHLKPVIRTVSVAQSGAIKGVVDPSEAMPAVFAIVEKDTIATAYTSDTGQFLLRGLPEGNYTVSFDPKEGFQPVQQTNVKVTIGSVTDLGKVAIP